MPHRARLMALAAIAFGLAGSVLPGVTHAADKLEQIKQQGYIRGATANEVPYGFMDENGKAAGIGPDVAAQVLKTMGVNDVEWVVTPFGSLIPGLKANRYDFVAAEQNILPERCKQVQFTTPNSSYSEGLLVKAGNSKNLHSYEDVKKNPAIKMAIVTGADQLDFAHAMGIPDSQLVMIPNNADALSTVQTGRSDAYAATELTVARLAAHSSAVAAAEPFTDPVVNGKPVRSYGAFSFRPQDKDLFNAFNEKLTAFKKTPGYKAILTHYGLSKESVEAAENASTAALCAGK